MKNGSLYSTESVALAVICAYWYVRRKQLLREISVLTVHIRNKDISAKPGALLHIKEEERMTITANKNGTALEVALPGRLDTMTAPELEKELNEQLDGAEKLVFDFASVEYISSAGLRVLLSAHKKMSTKGGMTIKNINEIVREVFEVTGFTDILNIE